MTNRLVSTYRSWRKYRETYNELMRLSNRDLADLGINRSRHPDDRAQVRFGSSQPNSPRVFSSLTRAR